MQKKAYAARYGHQPLSEIEGWSMAKLDAFNDAIGAIVGHENGKPSQGDDDVG